MKFLVFVVLSACLWHTCRMEDDALSSLKTLSRSNWEFSNLLYAAISNLTDASENILISPLSVHLVLTMCYFGAGGRTAEQISRALRLPHSAYSIKTGYSHLLKALPSSGDVALQVANIIFPAKRFAIRDNFTETVQVVFKSEIKNIDYSKSADAAETINGWVGHKTHNKITKAVSADILTKDTLMILVNAIYFKGVWEKAFNKTLTTTSSFYVNTRKTVAVDMMHRKMSLRYEEHDDIGLKVVEVPYGNKTTSLVIVLPLEVDGLAGVEARLREVDLKKVLTSRKTTDVDLALPRFSLHLSTDLNMVLERLGMKDMFQAKANFSRMSTRIGLSVSGVMHKTLIDVNEEGTEAAAVTSVQITNKMFADSKEFVADRPFLFALVSRRAGVVLFMGRYTGPHEATLLTYKSVSTSEARARDAASLVRGCSWLVVMFAGLLLLAEVSRTSTWPVHRASTRWNKSYTVRGLIRAC